MMHNFLITLNTYSISMKDKRFERLDCFTSLENHFRRAMGKKARQNIQSLEEGGLGSELQAGGRRAGQ